MGTVPQSGASGSGKAREGVPAVLSAQGIDRAPQTHRGPERRRQSGIGRTYGFAAANPVRPPSPPSVRPAFAPASLAHRPAACPRPCPFPGQSPRRRQGALGPGCAPAGAGGPAASCPGPSQQAGQTGRPLPPSRFLKGQSLPASGPRLDAPRAALPPTGEAATMRSAAAPLQPHAQRSEARAGDAPATEAGAAARAAPPEVTG